MGTTRSSSPSFVSTGRKEVDETKDRVHSAVGTSSTISNISMSSLNQQRIAEAPLPRRTESSSSGGGGPPTDNSSLVPGRAATAWATMNSSASLLDSRKASEFVGKNADLAERGRGTATAERDKPGSSKSSLSLAGETIVPTRYSKKLIRADTDAERRHYARSSNRSSSGGGGGGEKRPPRVVDVHSRTGRRPWQTGNIVSVSALSTSSSSYSSSSKSFSVRGNRVRARPSSAYPERRSRGIGGHATNLMAAADVLAKDASRGRRSERPSSAPRQRKVQDMKRGDVADSGASMVKNTFKAAPYVGSKDAQAQQHRKQRQHRVRPQSAALSGRRRRRIVQSGGQDPERALLGNKSNREGGSAGRASLGRTNIDGMIIVKQWRPESSRTSKRPQTALGMRRRRRHGLEKMNR